jgi:hypothetical protein
MAESLAAPSATDPTTQATYDYLEVDSTFHEVDDDNISEHHDDPSARRSFLGVSRLCLATITAVLNHVLFFS